MTLTFGSLFAGIGGFDLGFERAGMVCKWQVEINDYATKVLAKHWPDVRRWPDVRTWPQPDTERVDVICGGFPCQDISYAGQGAGLDGERSGLFFEAVRVVRELRPRIVVLENVAALLTRGLDRVLGTLAEIGYDAEWHCIPAAAVGAPHIRDRVWVVAYSTSECSRKSDESGRSIRLNASSSQDRTIVRDVIGIYGENVSNTHKTDDPIEAMENGAKSKRPRWTEPGRLDEFRSESGARQWGSEPDVGRVANGVPARVDRLRGLGNSIVPQVAEWIGRRITEAHT